MVAASYRQLERHKTSNFHNIQQSLLVSEDDPELLVTLRRYVPGIRESRVRCHVVLLLASRTSGHLRCYKFC